MAPDPATLTRGLLVLSQQSPTSMPRQRPRARRHISRLDAAFPAEENSAEQKGSLGVSCGGGLTIVLHSSDGVLLVRLYGPVGPGSRRGLYSALNAAFISRPIRIVIDGSDITECDKRGMATFVDAAERASTSGIPLAMYGLATGLRETLAALWRPVVVAELSYPSLQSAWAAVNSKPVASDRTRAELLEDVRHLQEAVSHSQMVEQAKGVLMATYGITAQAALDLLVSYSRAHSLSVRVLASRVTSVVHRRPTGSQMDALLGDPALGSNVDLYEREDPNCLAP